MSTGSTTCTLACTAMKIRPPASIIAPHHRYEEHKDSDPSKDRLQPATFHRPADRLPHAQSNRHDGQPSIQSPLQRTADAAKKVALRVGDLKLDSIKAASDSTPGVSHAEIAWMEVDRTDFRTPWSLIIIIIVSVCLPSMRSKDPEG